MVCLDGKQSEAQMDTSHMSKGHDLTDRQDLPWPRSVTGTSILSHLELISILKEVLPTRIWALGQAPDIQQVFLNWKTLRGYIYWVSSKYIYPSLPTP